jgi:hypothetical protein
VTISEPYGLSSDCRGGPGIGNAGFPGYRAVSGVGILVQVSGSAYQGTFPRPLALRLAGPSIRRSSIVAVWDGSRFVRAPHAVVRRRLAKVRVDRNSDLAILTPVSSLRRPGATRRASVAARARRSGGEILAALFFGPAGSPLPGLGVLAPAWLAGSGIPGAAPR